MLNCLLLSECAYKIADMSQKAATRKVQRVKQTFPKGMITLESVQWSLPNLNHRSAAAFALTIALMWPAEFMSSTEG